MPCAWYEWTGDPQQVWTTWVDGAETCFGGGNGCEAFPSAELEPVGPWMDAKSWYLEQWLPIAPDTGNWNNPWDTGDTDNALP